MSKPKVAIIRGSSLNSWEMQNYAPLTEDFDLCAVSTRRVSYDTAAIGFPVKKLWSPADLSPIKKFGSERYFGLEKALADTQIVHSVGIFQPFNEQLVKLKKELRFKLVATFWENIPYLWTGAGSNNQKIHRRKQQVIASVDKFIAITERARQTLLLEGAPDEKIIQQFMGIDIDRFHPQPRDATLLCDYELAESDKIILFVGRLTGNKGERELVFAAKRLEQLGLVDKYNLKFVVVGQGPYLSDLHNLLQRTKLTNVFRLIKQVPYQKMPAVHNLADIFYLGSVPVPVWQEQFGMVLIEAMASGKPVVAAQSGSISEVVGDAGVLFPPADFYALSEELKKLLKDPKRCNELGQQGRQRAEELFDSQKVAQNIGQIYKELL